MNNWCPLELYKVISIPGDDYQVTQSKEVSVRETMGWVREVLLCRASPEQNWEIGTVS